MPRARGGRLALEELLSFPPWVLGGSESHLLVFTPDGVAQGSAATEVQLTVADPTTLDLPLLP